MDSEQAFTRHTRMLERVARIERTGSVFWFTKPAVKTCEKHGEYSAAAHRCPVCDGQNHGGRPGRGRSVPLDERLHADEWVRTPTGFRRRRHYVDPAREDEKYA